MGVIAVKWVCPRCKNVVAGSKGELVNHYRREHLKRENIKEQVRSRASAA